MRLVLTFAAACAVNALLFLAMVQMITTDRDTRWVATTDADFFNFIRPRTAPEPAPRRRPPKSPPKPEAEPPAQTVFQGPASSQPVPVENLRALPLPSAALKVDIPLGTGIEIGAGPSLPRVVTGGTSRTGRLGTAPGSGHGYGSGHGSGLGRGLAQPSFIMADELVALSRIQPDYPDNLRFRRIEGEVTVEFIVTESGEVRDPKVIESSPRGSFDRAALRAIRRWRFQPRRDEAGKPVPVRVRQRFVFNLR